MAEKDYTVSLFHEEPKTTHAIGLPPDHYKQIWNMVKDRRAGRILTDRNGNKTRFYIHEGKLFGRKYLPDGTHTTEPVLDIGNLPMEAKAYNETREKVRNQVRKDFPDYTEEEVEAFTDIIEEGSMTARRLAASGIPINVAHKIVFSSLNSDNIDPQMLEKWLTENASTNIMESPSTATSESKPSPP